MMKKACLICALFVLGSMTVLAGPPPHCHHHHHHHGGCSSGLGLAAGIVDLVSSSLQLLGGFCRGCSPNVVVVPQQPVLVAAPPQPTIVYQTASGGYYVQPVTQPVQIQYYQPPVQAVPMGCCHP